MPFADVVGHRRLVGLLSRAVAHDRLPPALLLGGRAGIGKRTVAMALASAVNCLRPQVRDGLERDACGSCAACQRIARGVHPDVLLLAPDDTGKIKIDVVREVIAKAGFRPFEARRRVVVFDEADALVEQAQHALLKTLEEPPSASMFVLVSSLPDSLLPTVRSRCPRLRFGPLSPAEIATVLVRDHDYEEVDARAAAVDADGSVGRALSAEAADLVEARATATRVLQIASRTDAAGRIGSAQDLSPKKNTPAAERDQMAACLRVMASVLRDLGLLATRTEIPAIANVDLRGELDALVRSYDVDRSVRAYAAVDKALAALERNANARIVANWLVLQL
jgi:DNA polymerase-3 subunit delta'